jgi:hypothetical protein
MTDQPTIPWWQSRTIWCAVVPLVVSIARLFGVSLPDDVQASLPDVLMAVASAVGAIGAIIYRVKAIQPIAVPVHADTGTKPPAT